MEDPDILVDLRHKNMNGSDKYRVFWNAGSFWMSVLLCKKEGMIVCAYIWPRL